MNGATLLTSGAAIPAKYAPQVTSVWVDIGHVGNDNTQFRSFSAASTSSRSRSSVAASVGTPSAD